MDTAFEKARAAYGTGAYDDATLEFLFPQLKESEGERIRQLVYSSIKNDMPIASPKNKELALSWLEKQKEQKPAEWSEEEENVIETLIRELRLNAQFEIAVRKIGLDYVQTLTVLDKCRRLCPQYHWKPSEQEKGALRTAIHILTEERNFPKAAGHLQAILDAFDGKEFRKEWKPSKEQMSALNYFIKLWGKSDDQLEYTQIFNTVKSLRDELEKLM